MKTRTKDEILDSMIEEMPFSFTPAMRPYIKEAMDIYLKEHLRTEEAIQQEREKWKDILKEEIINLYVEANTSCDCEDCKKIKDKDRIFANNYYEEVVKPRIESK